MILEKGLTPLFNTPNSISLARRGGDEDEKG
jgi:hypothetical protein